MIKAISLWQPWATLIALGIKEYETRSWHTSYRGPLAILSTKTMSPECRGHARFLMNTSTKVRQALHNAGIHEPCDFPNGYVLAVTRLAEVYTTDQIRDDVSMLERYVGDFGSGRYAWQAVDTVVLSSPRRARGGQRLFNIDVSEFFDIERWKEVEHVSA